MTQTPLNWFGILEIGPWNLSVIWCLEFDAYFSPFFYAFRDTFRPSSLETYPAYNTSTTCMARSKPVRG